MTSPPDLRVRDASAADIEAFVPLLGDLGYPTPADTIRERFARLSANGERVIIAETGGSIVGLMTVHSGLHVLHRPKPVCRITMLVVAERARGMGVGRALVREAERIATEYGCGVLEVTSNLKRAEAHAFYEKLGFDRTSYRFGRLMGD